MTECVMECVMECVRRAVVCRKWDVERCDAGMHVDMSFCCGRRSGVGCSTRTVLVIWAQVGQAWAPQC